MNTKNTNSFAEHMNRVVKNMNNSISALNGLSETIISNDDVVNIDMNDGTYIQIPSYQNLLNRLKVVENTVENFTGGNGVVKTVDGTNRQIKVETLPKVPTRITNVVAPTKFKTNANWFFESLMFPKIVVSIDLTDKVEESSDRLLVNRVIIPLNDDNNKFYEEQIKDKNLSYENLISLLTSKEVDYYEDLETVYFPLKSEKYSGIFNIIKSETINGIEWYYLDTLFYGYSNDTNNTANIELKLGDTLRYYNSLFEIANIDKNTKRISLKPTIGLDKPIVGADFSYYESPFASKNIEIGIGIDEINCVYLKGVDENFNLTCAKWSECVNFISNNLVNENEETLYSFYRNYVSDFGAEWISQAKEKRVSAYNGSIPNIPTLNSNDFKVVHINTQLNSTLDKNKIIDLSSQITSLKSTIESSRNTIAQIKSNLASASVDSERYQLQNLLTNEELTLSTSTSEYNSLVNELLAFSKENDINLANPKYRVRGFFAIPEPINGEEVIGFDIKYRYIKNDETGVELGTYNYSNGDNTTVAVFSDWNLTSSHFKEKKYNSELDVFEWVEESVGDGNSININQIDIPINAGEKVEFCVRSVSEAGYPNCPRKSDWSESVIVSFPENLMSTNQISNLITDIKSDYNAILLNSVLESAGVNAHLSDEVISPDKTKTYRHNSDNVYYIKKTIDDNRNEVTQTISVSSMLRELLDRIEALENK
jgi:hypothetical protein